MENKEFLKLVNQELDGLRYYAHIESRQSLTVNSNLYNEFIPMGYTKRPMKLDRRCASVSLTSNNKISPNIKLEDLIIIHEPKDDNNNKYTPLEVFWIKYPDKRNEILINITSEQFKVKPIKF